MGFYRNSMQSIFNFQDLIVKSPIQLLHIFL